MKTEFFLGANSYDGFYSLYDGFCNGKGDFLYLIKGGAGCGKSSFMKKVGQKAEALGYDVQYVLCSGDPDSLDGVYIPDLKLGLVDATSPHIIEPRLFAVNSYYVNLGEYCSIIGNDKIAYYTDSYKRMYEKAYRYLSAAKNIEKIIENEVLDEKTIEKVKIRAKSFINRALEIYRSDCESYVEHRFISAVCCKGIIHLNPTVNVLCKQVFVVDKQCGLGYIFMKEIENAVSDLKLRAVICPCPLSPDRTEAVLLPEQSIGIVISSAVNTREAYSQISLDDLVENELSTVEKQYDALLDSAVSYLKKAKEYHDLLELEYRPYIDFDSLNDFTEKFIDKYIK